MENYVLHNYFRSSTSFRVRIALHLKNIPFEYKAIHLLKDGGQQNKPTFRQLNPAGGVPALQDGEFVLGESMAIIEFLDAKHPDQKLIPTDLKAAAVVRQICETMNCHHSYTNLKTLQFLSGPLGLTDQQKKMWTTHWLNSTLETLEKLAMRHSGKFYYQDQITAADVFLIPYLTTSRRFEIDTSLYTNLTKIEKNCMEIEAFQKSTPDKQPDYNP